MVKQDMDVDGLLEKILQSPQRALLYKALSRLMAEKLRIRREQSILQEAVRYEQELGTRTVSGRIAQLWWKEN